MGKFQRLIHGMFNEKWDVSKILGKLDNILETFPKILQPFLFI